MKILRIGVKNLASLAGEFEVDFEREPLASSGLFAISGPTGAGLRKRVVNSVVTAVSSAGSVSISVDPVAESSIAANSPPWTVP